MKKAELQEKYDDLKIKTLMLVCNFMEEVIKYTQRRPIKYRGCDVCKKKKPTEKFLGYCYNEIYICSECLDKMYS